jgi:hypothetical protein
MPRTPKQDRSFATGGAYWVADKGDLAMQTSPTIKVLSFPEAYTISAVVLNGNVARRRHDTDSARSVIWDAELPGFGLRVRRGHPHGSWVVRFCCRATDRLITLGRSVDLVAAKARGCCQVNPVAHVFGRWTA